MQKIQTFSGSVTLGSTSGRITSFGQTGTTTQYTSHTEVINNTIASFLQSCGVDAAYEIRSDADAANKWLWIEGVPFLFVRESSSSGYFFVRYPGLTGYIWNASVSLFSAYNGTAYNFRLGFAGKAKNAWILRIGLYNKTEFAGTYNFLFYHGKDLTDGGEILFYGDAPGSVTNGCNINLMMAKIADGAYVKTVGELIEMEAPMQVWGGNVAGWKAKLNGAFPLIPLTCGPYLIPGVYKYFGGVGLPQGALETSDVQTEADLGGRKFLITSIDDTTTSYYNTGLIETT